MANFRFGSGLLFATPLSGSGPAFTFGTLQDASVDFESDEKMLYGSNDFPDIAANGRSKASVKAKFGLVSGGLFNALYYGGTPSAGMMMLQLNEAQSVPASSPYTVTATYASGTGILANSATDLSVSYAATGTPLQNIGTGTPAQGQYTVSNGVYTFAAADSGAALILRYYYRTTTATSGTTYSRNQQLIGTTPFFSLFLYNAFGGLQSNMKFFRVKAKKLAMQTKNDDFMVPEMDFTILADPLGRVFESYEAVSPLGS